ncbi:hypothetical protein HWV62_45402, partial [Athelia sp. TMB]
REVMTLRMTRSHTPHGETDDSQLHPPVTRSKSGRPAPTASQPQRAPAAPSGGHPQPKCTKKSATESSPAEEPITPRRRGHPRSAKETISPPSPVHKGQAPSPPLTVLTSDPLPFGPSFPPGATPSRRSKKPKPGGTVSSQETRLEVSMTSASDSRPLQVLHQGPALSKGPGVTNKRTDTSVIRPDIVTLPETSMKTSRRVLYQAETWDAFRRPTPSAPLKQPGGYPLPRGAPITPIQFPRATGIDRQVRSAQLRQVNPAASVPAKDHRVQALRFVPTNSTVPQDLPPSSPPLPSSPPAPSSPIPPLVADKGKGRARSPDTCNHSESGHEQSDDLDYEETLDPQLSSDPLHSSDDYLAGERATADLIASRDANRARRAASKQNHSAETDYDIDEVAALRAEARHYARVEEVAQDLNPSKPQGTTKDHGAQEQAAIARDREAIFKAYRDHAAHMDEEIEQFEQAYNTASLPPPEGRPSKKRKAMDDAVASDDERSGDECPEVRAAASLIPKKAGLPFVSQPEDIVDESSSDDEDESSSDDEEGGGKTNATCKFRSGPLPQASINAFRAFGHSVSEQIHQLSHKHNTPYATVARVAGLQLKGTRGKNFSNELRKVLAERARIKNLKKYNESRNASAEKINHAAAMWMERNGDDDIECAQILQENAAIDMAQQKSMTSGDYKRLILGVAKQYAQMATVYDRTANIWTAGIVIQEGDDFVSAVFTSDEGALELVHEHFNIVGRDRYFADQIKTIIKYDVLKKTCHGHLSYWDVPSVEARDWWAKRLFDYLLSALSEFVVKFYFTLLRTQAWQQTAWKSRVVLVGVDTTMPCQPGRHWDKKKKGTLRKPHYEALIKRIPSSYRSNPYFSMLTGGMPLDVLTLDEFYKVHPEHQNDRQPAVVTFDGRILVYASDSKEALRADFVKYTVQPVKGDDDEGDDEEQDEEESDEEDDEEDDEEEEEHNMPPLKRTVGRAAPVKIGPTAKSITKVIPGLATKPVAVGKVKGRATSRKPPIGQKLAKPILVRGASEELSDDGLDLQELDIPDLYVAKPSKPFSPLVLPDLPPVRPAKRFKLNPALRQPSPPAMAHHHANSGAIPTQHFYNEPGPSRPFLLLERFTPDMMTLVIILIAMDISIQVNGVPKE